MVLQSELLSHADRVGEGLMLSPPPLIYNVRARGIVLRGEVRVRSSYIDIWLRG